MGISLEEANKLVLAPTVPVTASKKPISLQEANAGLTKNYTLGEAALEGVKNFLPDVGNVAVQTVKSLAHPIDTAKSILDIGSGAMVKNIPGYEKFLLATGSDTPEELERVKGIASNVGNFYKDRYGSYEGFKRALAEHPAEVLADYSTLVGGAGSLVSRVAPKGGKAAKIATMLKEEGAFTNPLNIPEKAISGAGKLATGTAKQVIGKTTGTSADTLSTAYEAGKTGGTSFLQNLTKKEELPKVVETAKSALSTMKQNKNQEYRSGMIDVSKDKSVLDFADIDNALADAGAYGTYKGQQINKSAVGAVQKARQAVTQWKKLNPTEYHTPEGMDALKQKIGSILDEVPYEQSQARSAIEKIYNATKETVKKQAPTYADVMKDYAEASDLIREIEKGLSLKDKTSIDTSLRKLQSVTRNNAQTNYGQRANLVKALEQAGGQDIMPALAGQALSEWFPRGATGALEAAGGGIAAVANPAIIPNLVAAAPFASPRVMGATAYGAGKVAGKVNKATSKLPVTVDQANKLALALYQMRNAQENQGE